MFTQFISNHLDSLYRWLTVLAIVLPLLGGFAGWGAWILGERISGIKDREMAASMQRTTSELEVARKQADEARSLAQQLEEARRPRIITDAQRAAFKQFMEKYPKGPVRVFSISSSNEVTLYAQQIASLLEGPEYALPPETKRRIWLGGTIGISVENGGHGTCMLMARKESNYAGHIQRAFESIGIAMPGLLLTSEQAAKVIWGNEVVIYVAERQ